MIKYDCLAWRRLVVCLSQMEGVSSADWWSHISLWFLRMANNVLKMYLYMEVKMPQVCMRYRLNKLNLNLLFFAFLFQVLFKNDGNLVDNKKPVTCRVIGLAPMQHLTCVSEIWLTSEEAPLGTTRTGLTISSGLLQLIPFTSQHSIASIASLQPFWVMFHTYN